MRTIITRLIVVTAFLSVLLAPSIATAAFNPFDNLKCKDRYSDASVNCCADPQIKESAVCKNSSGDDPLTGPNGVLLKVTSVVAIIAGFMAVLILVLAGFRYITSGGSSEQVAQAKKTVIYALIGIIAIALGQGIISYIISRI